jgi:ABC-2 type transport system permease protein
METMKAHFWSGMGVMLGRSMRHISRSMDTIITVTLMPIAFMLRLCVRRRNPDRYR